MKGFMSIVVVTASLAVTAVAWGHHSYAMFEMQKEVDVQGTVKEFHYTNPHSWIVLAVQDAAGNVSNAVLEANGPGYLTRFGWNRNILKAGDKIVATINPLRDGSPGGSLVQVKLSDGRELNARPGGPPIPDAVKEHK